MEQLLQNNHIEFKTFKDHVIFEKDEIVKDDGKPYTVFTPYKRKWLEKLTSVSDSVESSPFLESYNSEGLTDNFFKTTSTTCNNNS